MNPGSWEAKLSDEMMFTGLSVKTESKTFGLFLLYIEVKLFFLMFLFSFIVFTFTRIFTVAPDFVNFVRFNFVNRKMFFFPTKTEMDMMDMMRPPPCPGAATFHPAGQFSDGDDDDGDGE